MIPLVNLFCDTINDVMVLLMLMWRLLPPIQEIFDPTQYLPKMDSYFIDPPSQENIFLTP